MQVRTEEELQKFIKKQHSYFIDEVKNLYKHIEQLNKRIDRLEGENFELNKKIKQYESSREFKLADAIIDYMMGPNASDDIVNNLIKRKLKEEVANHLKVDADLEPDNDTEGEYWYNVNTSVS